MKHTETDLLDKTVEITVAAVSAAPSVSQPENVANLIQAVFDKLKQINDSLS